MGGITSNFLFYSQVQATEHSFADNPNPPERQARL